MNTTIDPAIRASIQFQAPDLFGHTESKAPPPAEMILALTDRSAPWRMTQKALAAEIDYDEGNLSNVKNGKQKSIADPVALARLTALYREHVVQPETAERSDAISAKLNAPKTIAAPTEDPAPALEPIEDRGADATAEPEQEVEISAIGESATATPATDATQQAERASRMAEAERFLLALDEEAEFFTFQTFDDLESRKSKHLAAIQHGTLEQWWDWLESMNQTGAGVFVTINATDRRGREVKNITRVRAVFADFDPPKTAAAPEQYPLPPMIEVESSPGKRHAYWMVDDLPLEAFQPMQKAISAALGSDPALNDLPRVMRLPGFRHMKDPTNPAWVRLLSAEPRLPYTADELERVFRPAAARAQGTKTPGDGRGQDDYLAELLSGENVHDAALKIVGRMVRDGVTNATIKATFAVLAEKVAEVRGADRASALMGDELARMIRGAREKGYDNAAPASHTEQPDDTEKLTEQEAEALIAWSWRTGTALPAAREQFEGAINPRTGKPAERLRVNVQAGTDFTAPWLKMAWESGKDDFLSRVDGYLPRREAMVEAENARRMEKGQPPAADIDSAYLRQHARDWQARIQALSVSDETARGLLARITPPWPEPQPITVKVSPEPYPFDALPLMIQMAVKEVFDFVKAPLPMVATSALAALSLAIQAHYDIKRAEKLSGPVSLFTLAIADSGERKSTLDKLFTAAIRQYEAAATERAKPDLKRYAANQMSWKSKQEGLQAAIREAAKKGKPTDELDLSMEQVQMDEPIAPRVPRLILGDETPESLAWSLAKVWPSSGVVSSEAGVIFGAHGMGKDSIMRHLGLLNILWDGGDLPIGRKTSETFTVRDVRLTVALQIQEATLRSFFDRAGGLARGTGFLARFLIAWPESTQGYRPFTEAPEHWPHLETFNRRLTAVLEQEPPINDDGRLEPSMLTLSPEAKAAWIEFANAIEVELRETGELYDVRDVASKCADNAARLAALFHIFEGAVGPVSLSAFEGASRVAAWHLTEARRFFGELAIPAELVDAAKLDGWLIEHCRRCHAETVCKRHLRQYGPLRDGARLDLALNELADMDRIRLAKDGRRTVIEVNPALCGGAS